MQSYTKSMKARTERIWIEENKDINIFNYWFYKFFTNRYIDFLLLNFRTKEKKEWKMNIQTLTTNQSILVLITLVLTFILGYLSRMIIVWARENKLKEKKE